MAKRFRDDRGRLLELRGECLRCGMCCRMDCPYLRFVANRPIKEGEVLSRMGKGQAMMTSCAADPKPGYCSDFPSSPGETKAGCGYSWVEVG